MVLETLKALPDEELESVITFAQQQLKERDRQRKEKAKEQANAILKAAGLTLQDIKPKGRPKNALHGKGKAAIGAAERKPVTGEEKKSR